jgi:hypothetical protein
MIGYKRTGKEVGLRSVTVLTPNKFTMKFNSTKHYVALRYFYV